MYIQIMFRLQLRIYNICFIKTAYAFKINIVLFKKLYESEIYRIIHTVKKYDTSMIYIELFIQFIKQRYINLVNHICIIQIDRITI